MEPENVIKVNNVKKSFKVYKDRGYMLKEMVLFANRRKYEINDVLKGISFNVGKGEAVGLVGQNGCGKSTTLKLLTKIIYPDSGSIEMKGRVSSLLELGAGFHPDMSGRENIYINAAIFGLTKNEIDERLDDIIAFSELEDYIDNPVRTYSSGMYMRLAFSVAINVDADILLIDEILAVGDANFQAKCFGRLKEIKAQGATIVIVSHSLGQIEQICERSIWIHDGRIMAEGTPREVHPVYLDYMGTKRIEIAKNEAIRQKKKEENVEAYVPEDKEADHNAQAEQAFAVENQTESVDDLRNISTEDALKKNKKRWGSGIARFQKIELFDENGAESTLFETGKSVTVKLHYQVKQKVEDAVIGIGIFRADGVYIYGSNTRIDKVEKFELEKDGMVQITLKNVNLMPGQYTMDFAIESGMGLPVDYYREAKKIEFFTTKDDVGLVRIDHDWVRKDQTERTD